MLEDVWRQKTDEEIALAASKLASYTEEAKKVIRMELHRRGMPEPPPTERVKREISKQIHRSIRDYFISFLFFVIIVLPASLVIGFVYHTIQKYSDAWLSFHFILIINKHGGWWGSCLYYDLV